MHYIQHNLRFYRKRNRYRQSDIAAKLKVSVGQVKTYETGIAVPPIDILIRIADMMKITLDDLVRKKLSEKNFPALSANPRQDILSRIKALEEVVNNTVNKRPQKAHLKPQI